MQKMHGPGESAKLLKIKRAELKQRQDKRFRVLFTGGPASGKSTLLSLLDECGYLCYPEEIRLLTRELLEETEPKQGENPLLLTDDHLGFNRRLIERRLGQWRDFEDRTGRAAFYDRGIPDVLAYMDAFDQPCPEEFRRMAREHRYDFVFVTPIWPEIYRNDSERMESIDTAYHMESRLLDTYVKYGYDPVPIPRMPPIDRMGFVLDFLRTQGLDFE